MINGFIALLQTETGSMGETNPILPNDNWQLYHEDNLWLSVVKESNNDVFFHMRLMVDGANANAPGKGVYLVAGNRALLKNLWDWCNNNGIFVWTISQLRADNSLRATRIKNAWKDERSGQSGSLVSLYCTMGGFNYGSDLELTLTGSDLSG